jgi:hypothetical protein
MSYSPVLGQWPERDPAGYVDGADLYEYVQGNPLTATDPTGLEKVVHKHVFLIEKVVEAKLQEGGKTVSFKVRGAYYTVTCDKPKDARARTRAGRGTWSKRNRTTSWSSWSKRGKTSTRPT